MIPPDPWLGTALHGVGAFFAAICYTPQKRVKGWSWQSYWLIQASVCWLLLPLAGAWLTIPELATVLRAAPRDAMAYSFLLGAAYGIGGTAFGIAIRYIGFSLTYAIAIGLSTVLGTLVPPLVKGTLGATLSKPGASWIVAGIAIGMLGIVFTGAAGRMKENDLRTTSNLGGFSIWKGMALSLLAGVLSAVYGFALEAGEPIAAVATDHGAGVFRGNVVYIFANSGAYLTTAIYCIYLHAKHKSLGEMVELPAGTERPNLPLNWAMAILTGFFWYGQFFFYNLGHVRMGNYKLTSWAIHMIMLILFSIVVGAVLREWFGTRKRTKLIVACAFVVLVAAVGALTYGNHLAEITPTTQSQR
jgi:L-rhamnose-H+ transport protein